MTHMYLVYGGGDVARDAIVNWDGPKPRLLVSYVYLNSFLRDRELPGFDYVDWILDSGAFTAWNTGKTIVIEKFIEDCLELQKDPKLKWIFALDVIGDWRGSLANTEKMWKGGVPAVPCFHQGEPWHAMDAMSRDYPRLALGGLTHLPHQTQKKWVKQVFARYYDHDNPKPWHGFGIGGPDIMGTVPFYSADAASWMSAPGSLARWYQFRRYQIKVPVKGWHDLRGEINARGPLSRKLMWQWRKVKERQEQHIYYQPERGWGPSSLSYEEREQALTELTAQTSRFGVPQSTLAEPPSNV